MLLDNLTFSGTMGGEPFLAYLIDMNWLFEKYVCGILKSAARNWGVTVQEQYHCSLDVHRRVMMRPDAVFLRRGETVLAADAKYKLSPNHGDVYQMLAYCHALGLPEGVLVYPEGETAPAGAISIRGPGGVRVHYLALDLAGGQAELEIHGTRLAAQFKHCSAHACSVAQRHNNGTAATPDRRDP